MDSLRYLQKVGRFPQNKGILLPGCILLQFPLQWLFLQTCKISEMCNWGEMQTGSAGSLGKVANVLVSAGCWSDRKHKDMNSISTYNCFAYMDKHIWERKKREKIPNGWSVNYFVSYELPQDPCNRVGWDLQLLLIINTTAEAKNICHYFTTLKRCEL